MRFSRDLSIYNEATGFSLHPRGMGGMTREELGEDLPRHVWEGLVIPVSLVQDSCLHVRVVVGDLTADEEEQWVGRIAWKLTIPCGTLAVEGGLDPRVTDEDRFVKFVEVPPGDYAVEVFTYLNGVNGDYCVRSVDREPLGTWFRRTRPDAEMPRWLKFQLVEDIDEDPGHDDEWEEFEEYLGGLSNDEYDAFMSWGGIDFLVRLSPPEVAPAEPGCNAHGWFPIETGARKPEIFPLGLYAEEKAGEAG